ncbi:MAG: ferrochelatase [Desulfobulbus sp.]|jgi:ferrochelatase
MNTHEKTGVLLLNLGGPERQEDVRPFLVNLFSDRDIIRLGPKLLQKPLAHLIAHRRAPHSMANYRRIGGGSPLRAMTDQQAAALETALQQDGAYVVHSCMRYWHPFADEALLALHEKGVDKIVALPLYPHYSIATTGSSMNDLRRAHQRSALADLEMRAVHSWPDEPHFIDCLATRIQEGLAGFHGAPVQLLYSAHSLPMQFIREGDPYVEHLQRTIGAIEEQTGVRGILCYQSRSGPVEWLGPSIGDEIKRLAKQKTANLLVVPISFVSDHVETLYEIDIQYRAQAEELGMGFAVTRAPNADPRFIEGLRQLVLSVSR